jgi:hypothetical protein
MSSIGWVDFSSTDREKVAEVLAMLQEPGTLDELGIGQIRDAFADMLFPGFSTIQTRAKYFITVPRLIRDYQALPHKIRRKQTLSSYLEEQEHMVAKKLVEHHKSDQTAITGIIGASKVNDPEGVARRPSSIYWNGLRQFGLVNTRFSLAEFSRSLASQGHSSAASLSEDDDQDAHSAPQYVHLDRYDPEWMKDLSLKLTPSEAQFLAEKLTHNHALQDSVVSQILIHDIGAGLLGEDRKLYESFPALCQTLMTNDALSIRCKYRLQLANQFSEALAGAHIRYNIVLAQNAKNMRLVEEREQQYQEWLAEAQQNKSIYPDCANIWLQCAGEEGARINSSSQSFVRQWCTAVLKNAPTAELDLLVRKQAESNKGKRSLLLRSLGENPSWQGMERLSYRWGTVQIILSDIMEGLAWKAG